MSEHDWRAIRELLALRSRLVEIVDHALMPSPASPLGRSDLFEPPADLWETDDEIVIQVELPGVTTGDIKLHLDDGCLVLAGRRPETQGASTSYLRIERPRGSFSRHIPLPAEVTGEPAATLTGGVLEVRLPKKVCRARRQVVIQNDGG
jgi:HSP20 family protein